MLVGPSPGLSVQEVPELLARSYWCLPSNHTSPVALSLLGDTRKVPQQDAVEARC